MSGISFKEIDLARKTLELPSSATLKEIQKAYRALCKKWHPDKCQEKELCHEKMKEINRSYKLILKYIDGYSYAFTEKKVVGDSPEERWKAQFGGDPHWGKGWDK